MDVELDRRLGGLVGLLVGDALGVPYEFHDPRALPPRPLLEMSPPDGFRRSHAGVPPGTWSDDGSHALALLDSLVTCGGWDAEDFGRRLVSWWGRGAYAVDARPFDIGIQTTAALNRLESGVPAAAAGPAGERDNGNGSLMRCLPLALWFEGDDAGLVALARAQSTVTHGHVRSQLCCAIQVVFARELALGSADAFDRAVAAVERTLTSDGERSELSVILGFSELRGSGYVVDTLHVARRALEAGDYEAVVRDAIAWGLDTDTSACVAGGLAGVRDGLSGIPVRWRRALRGGEVWGPLAARWLGLGAEAILERSRS